ncbi:hypothetical protein ON010_g2645 [Phytophthora cinnamomi]|nr:hypothetical protein ON010_g2645 [Phytophthora cinnamomi]
MTRVVKQSRVEKSHGLPRHPSLGWRGSPGLPISFVVRCVRFYESINGFACTSDRGHLRDDREPATPLAHAPLAQVAVGLDALGRQQHHAADGHGRVHVGEGHEGHADDGQHGPGAREVAGHAERADAVDAAEDVERHLEVLHGEELLGATHDGGFQSTSAKSERERL